MAKIKPSLKGRTAPRYPAFNAVQNYLRGADVLKIKKPLGYFSTEKCQRALEKFCAGSELYEWLDCGFFDLKHTSESFIEKCVELAESGEIPNVAAADLKAEIAKAKIEVLRWNDLYASYIRVQTDFVRQNQPLFSLGLSAGMLSFGIIIRDEYLEKGVQHCLKTVPPLLRAHYEDHGGKLPYPFSSNILGYTLFLQDAGKRTIYYFDTAGNRVESPAPNNTNFYASFSIG